MSAVTIVFAVLQLLSGLALTVIVLMQSGKSAGLSGAITLCADRDRRKVTEKLDKEAGFGYPCHAFPETDKLESRMRGGRDDEPESSVLR